MAAQGLGGRCRAAPKQEESSGTQRAQHPAGQRWKLGTPSHPGDVLSGSKQAQWHQLASVKIKITSYCSIAKHGLDPSGWALKSSGHGRRTACVFSGVPCECSVRTSRGDIL